MVNRTPAHRLQTLTCLQASSGESKNARADELDLSVNTHPNPNTIQWGPLGSPHLYTFDPARAPNEGVDALVDDAIRRMHADRP